MVTLEVNWETLVINIMSTKEGVKLEQECLTCTLVFLIDLKSLQPSWKACMLPLHSQIDDCSVFKISVSSLFDLVLLYSPPPSARFLFPLFALCWPAVLFFPPFPSFLSTASNPLILFSHSFLQTTFASQHVHSFLRATAPGNSPAPSCSLCQPLHWWTAVSPRQGTSGSFHWSFFSLIS